MNITKSQWILQIANKIKQSTKNNTVIHMLIIFYVVNIKLYVSKCTSKILCSNTTQCVRICKNIQKCYTLTHTILGIYVGVFEELSTVLCYWWNQNNSKFWGLTTCQILPVLIQITLMQHYKNTGNYYFPFYKGRKKITVNLKMSFHNLCKDTQLEKGGAEIWIQVAWSRFWAFKLFCFSEKIKKKKIAS